MNVNEQQIIRKESWFVHDHGPECTSAETRTTTTSTTSTKSDHSDKVAKMTSRSLVDPENGKPLVGSSPFLWQFAGALQLKVFSFFRRDARWNLNLGSRFFNRQKKKKKGKRKRKEYR